jgi:hypothetical protein
MGSVYGRCTSKKFDITPDWKCVDFQIDTNKYPTPKQQEEIRAKNRACDHFDVCPDCRYFEPV